MRDLQPYGYQAVLFIDQTDARADRRRQARLRVGRQQELLSSTSSEDCDDQVAPYKTDSKLDALITLIVSLGNEKALLD
ncbi:MAG: hypothetical protein CV088_21555 [Nitrospira sp. LK70]|nr:hypothetical protein [Nitrospira sp. LK70]